MTQAHIRVITFEKMMQVEQHASAICSSAEPYHNIQVEHTMPLHSKSRRFLSLQAAIMLMVVLFFTSSFALESSSLLEFLGSEHPPFLALLPPTLAIEESFRPSSNPFAGTVDKVEGVAYVYHQDDTIAYTLKENLPLFNGDTLVTGEKSRLTLQMADESSLILTAETKLTIDRSLPRMMVRDTVLQLFFGRIRSLVKKLAGEYTIRTPTGSVGVRGTDFMVAVAPTPASARPVWMKHVPATLLTAVLTGGRQSTVELAGQYGPSVQVTPLSVAGVRTGGQAEPAVHVGPAAVALLQRVAPLPEDQSVQTSTSSSGTGPCWPFSFKPLNELKFFRICE